MFPVEEEQVSMPVIVPDSGQVMSPRRKVSIRVEEVDTNMLTIPQNNMAGSSSSETLTGNSDGVCNQNEPRLLSEIIISLLTLRNQQFIIPVQNDSHNFLDKIENL